MMILDARELARYFFKFIWSKTVIVDEDSPIGAWSAWSDCPRCRVEGVQTAKTRTRDNNGEVETDSEACEEPEILCRKTLS